jgi:hypothetical protein
MHQRQAVDQYRHIVAVFSLAILLPAGRQVCGVLIDDLQTVLVNVVFTEQINVFYRAILSF